MAATILCVDDDRNFCQIFARALRQEGYAVETAHDGDSALELVQSLAPQLVTLDVMLPRRDGIAVLEAVRQADAETRETPVILCSGATISPRSRERAQRLGVNAILRKPVPLDDLLAAVARHAGKPARRRSRKAPAQPSGRRTRRERAGRFEGSLEDIPFPALLHHLHGMRASGVLELESGKKRKLIQLREGQPVAVKSNLVNETLGNLLLASGKITRDVLHESLLRVKRGEGLHGQILRAMHMLDDEDLARALRNQAEEKLFEVFAWKRGHFALHRGARLKSTANTLPVRRSPGRIIMDGVTRRFPIERIDRILEEWTDRAAAPTESPYYHFQDIELDDAARSLLRRAASAGYLGELWPLDEPSRRTLFGLIAIEMLELGTATGRRRPPVRELHPTSRPHATMAGREEAVRAELAEMARRFGEQDYFGILEVSENASDDQVRHAYTALAKRTHPDRFAGYGDAVCRLSEEVFALVSLAYETLGDRGRRVTYINKQRNRDRDAAELEEGQRALQAELAFQKGLSALRGKAYAEAESLFRRAVERYGEEGEYQAYYGWALYLSDPERPGRLQEAIEVVMKGRKLAPDRDKPYLFLGRLLKAQGRMVLAEKMFSRAVQLAPECVEALRELRLIHMRREKSKGLVRRILRR